MSSRQIASGDRCARQDWMALLAQAPLAELERHWAAIDRPKFQWIRRPEYGAAMLRGAVGRTGSVFNLGEATVTRCTVQVETGEIGIAYVLGRNKRHAALAALFDGLMQRDQVTQAGAIAPIIAALDQYVLEAERSVRHEAQQSKVDFFMLGREVSGK
ncbi:phosphonate C-P lyase system protein PhnG [Bradyrhizobium sp. CSA207]|uniref:phosphonate C-P lyase system protein PhnG n=1 Tax=Bradyrhizobium sp. CSA207 TaxID=2698826 RepID=UPI0023AF9C58|nr:phosphonate C-P lyase system protein PhnG [Bradyrhizobium sp. CSA207]MDE5447017.1 phosphonate C-P lyase system protein PhnG [Bradyrhizobium sp. CSA207]